MRSLMHWGARHLRLLVLGVFILFAYLAATIRPQPLPWAIAALLTATLIVGVAWPRWLVRRLSVTRIGPMRAGEGDTVTFHVEVNNHGWLPRFMVELIDRLPFVGAAAGIVDQAEKTLGVVAYVPGKGQRRFTTALLCEKRGFYRLGPAGLASSFPLGMAQARQLRNGGVQTLTIYPSIFPIVDLPLCGAPSQIHRGGYSLPKGAGAAEFSGLREYSRGDNPRHIHWPTTARLNELMVKEFEPLASACLYLALDLAAEANVGQGKEATLEYAIRIAASLANFSCANGIPVRVMGEGKQPLTVDGGSGEQHYQHILDHFAVLESDGELPYASVLEKVALDCQPGETVVVFLSEPETRSADTLQALSLLQAQGAYLFAVGFERQSFAARSSAVTHPSTVTLTSDPMSGVHELATYYVQVRRGDDLVHLFNQ